MKHAVVSVQLAICLLFFVVRDVAPEGDDKDAARTILKNFAGGRSLKVKFMGLARNEDGLITADDLVQIVYGKFGVEISTDTAKDIIRKIDSSADDSTTYEKFMAVVNNEPLVDEPLPPPSRHQ